MAVAIQWLGLKLCGGHVLAEFAFQVEMDMITLC